MLLVLSLQSYLLGVHDQTKVTVTGIQTDQGLVTFTVDKFNFTDLNIPSDGAVEVMADKPVQVAPLVFTTSQHATLNHHTTHIKAYY